MEHLRVLTLNTWNREGPYAQRLTLLRKCLRELEPDVVGLQEVLEGQTEELLQDAAMHHAWLGTERSGISIAARWPLQDRIETELPGAGADVGGVALAARVQTPAGVLPFVCATTFYPMPFESWKRQRQMPALAELVRTLRQRSDLPAVLVGDLNAEPESDEIRFLRGLHAIDSRGAYFCDAWERAGIGSDGATWTQRNAFSGPWGLPDRRIDYIFVAAPGVRAPALCARAGWCATKRSTACGPPITWVSSPCSARASKPPAAACWTRLNAGRSPRRCRRRRRRRRH